MGTVARKIHLQPRWCVMSPPRKGPIDSPRYAEATLIPSTRPRRSGGKTEMRIGRPVPKVMALPTPWATRQAMSAVAVGARGAASEAAV